jgi:hypothetical protein
MAKRMRLWRSLALPKVLQLRLAAICSAADAMLVSPKSPRRRAVPGVGGAECVL